MHCPCALLITLVTIRHTFLEANSFCNMNVKFEFMSVSILTYSHYEVETTY